MILLKLVSSDAANGECVSALRFLTVPKAAPVLTWPLYQIWPSDTIRLISLGALRQRKQSEQVGGGFKVSWKGQPHWARSLHRFQGSLQNVSVLERNVMGSKMRRENSKSKLIFISNTERKIFNFFNSCVHLLWNISSLNVSDGVWWEERGPGSGRTPRPQEVSEATCRQRTQDVHTRLRPFSAVWLCPCRVPLSTSCRHASQATLVSVLGPVLGFMTHPWILSINSFLLHLG